MEATKSQPVLGELPPPKSFAERFVGVFVSPGETLADVASKPDFIAPLVLLTLASVAVTETMLKKIGIERIVRMSIEHSSRASSMTPEQMDQAVNQGAKIGAIFAHAGALLGPSILLLVFAALGLLFVNAFFGGKINFKTAFSLASYGNLVSVLGSLMAIAVILFGDSEHFNPQSPMPTNPGFFLNPLETAKPLMALASSLDIFYFWVMALWGIGYSKASGRKASALSLFLCFLGIWVIITLIRMGLGTLS